MNKTVILTNYIIHPQKIIKLNNICLSTDTSSLNGMTPTHLLRESTSNSRWLEENINDFSLTSLLGHLDEINATRDILVSAKPLFSYNKKSPFYMRIL